MQALSHFHATRRTRAYRLILVLLFLSLTTFLSDASSPRASAAPPSLAPSPALKCKTHLTDVWLPSKFDTFAGHTSRNNALNWLDQNFGINTVGKLLRYFKSRVEFDKLLAPQFLTPESLTTIATRAELQCILPSISDNHRELLDSAALRSLYKLGEINPNDSLQVDALLHYLEKIAIAKGPPFYLAETNFLDMPPRGDVVNWIQTARATTPALKTCEDKKNQVKSENCLVFQDGTTYDFPPPSKSDNFTLVIPPRCIKRHAQDWDDQGVLFATMNAPSVLRLTISLVHPPANPQFDLMVHDANTNDVLLRRAVNAAHRTAFVFSTSAQQYRVRLKAVPATAKVCWQEITAQPLGAGETQTNLTIPLDAPEFRYYAYDAACTDNVNMTLTPNSGDSAYFVRAPLEAGLTPVVTGNVIAPSAPVPLAYPAGANCSSPANPRRFLIALGHFENVQDPCTPGGNNCRTLASAFQSVPSHASELQLGITKTSTVDTFYMARISQMTWSNDQENVLWEGEVNSYASTELVDPSNNSTTVGMDFPYYVYREAEDNDNPFVDLPTMTSDFPVLGIRKSALDANTLYFILSLSSYEDDSALLHYLNPITWYQIGADLYSAMGNCVGCVIGQNAEACKNAVCDLLRAVGRIGNQLASDEDDPFGTAAGRFDQMNSGDQSNFGILPGTKSRAVSMQGSANPDNNVWQDLQRIGEACSSVYAAAKYLMELAFGSEDKDPWVKADAQLDVSEVRSTIQQLRVQFQRVDVTNDRDGFGQGDGDMYVYSTVGTLGDSDTTTGQAGGLATPLPSDKLQALPFGNVDVMRLPQNGNRGMGDGDAWSPNAQLFAHSWLNTQFVAGLYVQIVMFDADNFEDDEVGIVSDYYSFQTLWQYVNQCAQGNVPGFVRDFGTNQCKVTRTTKAYTREYQKNKGAQGIWGVEGATFTYEIQITPTNWP